MRADLVIEGEGVRLEPLTPALLPQLVESGKDPALWEYTFQPNPFTNERDARAWLDYAMSAPGVQAFAVIDKRSGQVAGSTRYLDIDPAFRKLEIGWTFHARRFWRTHVNTETKLLLLRHAFEVLHCVRVQFKAEAVNRRSHSAILRLGARHEGTHRNFRIRPDGERRDVNFYSIVDGEWPAIEERLLSFLHAKGSEAQTLCTLSAE